MQSPRFVSGFARFSSRSLSSVCILCAVLLLFFAPMAASQAPEGSLRPALERLEDGRYRLGNLVLDKDAGTVSCAARVNMDEGLIEVFACTERGKLHEAALVVNVEPAHLQAALLALGLEHGPPPKEGSLRQRLRGDPVRVWVHWEDQDGNAVRWRAEELVWNARTEKPMEAVEWVFAGSRVINGTFMADVEGQLITTFRDPFTILDNPLKAGLDDTLYEVHAERMPEKGSPVQIVFEDARERSPR